MAGNFDWIGKSLDGNQITLYRFQNGFRIAPYYSLEWHQAHADQVRKGLVVDLETTGFNRSTDQILEIGVREFWFNRANGDLLKIGQGLSELQDPGMPISPDIQRLTGITNEDVAGKVANWDAINSLFEDAHLIIAHNASFDRPFIERKGQLKHRSKTWSCTVKQIQWADKGYFSSKLELLSIYHGFFVNAHRALEDCDALLHLITHVDRATQKTYLHELLTNARKPVVRIMATHSPFESKDFLKERGYSWDQTQKTWHRTFLKELLPDEIAWLEGRVYNGTFRGMILDIPPTELFRN